MGAKFTKIWMNFLIYLSFVPFVPFVFRGGR